MLRKAKQIDDAQKYFEQALAHYPDFPEAQLGLAAVLLERKEPGQALAHAQRAAPPIPRTKSAGTDWLRFGERSTIQPNRKKR
jgi:Tfp pilus assembly protein PilF